MKRILTASCFGISVFCGCHGSSGGVQFSIDTAQLRQGDSLAAVRRHSDSVLLRRADSIPGVNAGMDNFEIRSPHGWRRVDTLLGKIRAVMLDTASVVLKFRTNVNVVGDSLRGLSIDDYLKGTINTLAQYVHQFSLIGQGERPIAGRSARWIHYTQDLDGTGVENICYLIPDSGIVYVVTCSALKGRLVQHYQAFEGAIRSFTLR